MNACREDGVGRGAQEARRNGAVVHPRAQSRQRRGWGGRGLRLRRMERRCAGVVDAAGVALGEMGEDSLDDLGRLDARDDAQRAATHATVFDVDVEDALEPLHPAHGRGTRRMGLAGGLMGTVGDDVAAEFEVRGEHAVVCSLAVHAPRDVECNISGCAPAASIAAGAHFRVRTERRYR